MIQVEVLQFPVFRSFSVGVFSVRKFLLEIEYVFTHYKARILSIL